MSESSPCPILLCSFASGDDFCRDRPQRIAYVCRMSGSNNMKESDRRPLDFCPECLPKIWWTSGVDPHERFLRLAEFADEHRLDADSKLWHAIARRVSEVAITNRS